MLNPPSSMQNQSNCPRSVTARTYVLMTSLHNMKFLPGGAVSSTIIMSMGHFTIITENS